MVYLAWTEISHLLVSGNISIEIFNPEILDKILDLCKKYDAMLMIDECHATGILGPNGRGTDELLGVHGQIDIINSTLGKALGGASGGYTAGPKEIVDLLRQKSRPYLFSNTLAPPVVGAAMAALELLETYEIYILALNGAIFKYISGNLTNSSERFNEKRQCSGMA